MGIGGGMSQAQQCDGPAFVSFIFIAFPWLPAMSILVNILCIISQSLLTSVGELFVYSYLRVACTADSSS
jgi:hypothetical protein